MSEVTSIEHLSQHVGQTVTLRGWLYNKSSKGKLHFAQLRDGTGMRQRQCMLHLHVYVCARRSGQCCYSLSHAANPGLAHVEGAWHEGA